MLNVTFSDFIGLPKNETADSAQPRNRSTVTDPFPLLRAGSGDETTWTGSSLVTSPTHKGSGWGGEAYIIRDFEIF